ncbi:MAG: InlB B-repeat-containing protein, partial [Coriobacteriales bacterium]|nr:InlB B-repeat-containing protein [Coriobacteriales bacterium]
MQLASAVLGLVLAATMLSVLPRWTSYTDDDAAVLPSITRQPSAATYAKGTQVAFYVNASSVDGGYLSYQWYQSILYTSPQPTNPDGTLTSAAQATIKASGTAINTAAGKQAVLTTTAPATAGYYYYWVEITNNLDANGNGTTADPGETATRESAYVRAKVVDRTLEPQLMNGDFEGFGQMPHNASGYFVPTLDKQGHLYKDPTTMATSDAEGVPTSSAPGQLAFLLNGTTNTDFYWRTTDEWGVFQVFPQSPTTSNILEPFSVSDITLPTVTFKPASDRPKNYLVELNCWNTSSLYQDVATVPGKIYEWNFDYVRRGGGGGTVAVVIGESINTADDYTNNGYPINRFNKTLNGSAAIVDVPAAQLAVGGEWAYGHKDTTLFRDVVQEAVEDYDTSSYTDENAFLTAHPEAIGKQLTATYGNKNWSVTFINTVSGAADSHVPYSGAYSVPAGQGETVFGFVSIAPAGAAGNQLDNISFASGFEPAKSENISYAGAASLSATTKAGYAYALAEVRGSTVINLSGLAVTFNSAPTSPDAGLGTGSWYTPGAVGTLTFTGLTPGKTYRVIGIPTGSISAALGTNLSPADVLDSGYYQDTIMVSASAGTASSLPAVTYEYAGGGAGTVTASLAFAKSNVEYAILADDGSGGGATGAPGLPVTTGPALIGTPNTAWKVGTGSSLEFFGLDPATRYFLVARPVGYTEVNYAQAAFNTDGTVAALALKTPAAAAVDVVPGDITAAEDGTSVSVDTEAGYTYRLVDPETGEFVGNPIAGNGTTIDFSGYTFDPNKAYQIVAQASGDDVWMRGVRLFPYPDVLKIDFADESISKTGAQGGVVNAGVEYTIENFDGSYLAGSLNAWERATGTSSIDLGAAATGSLESILDSIPSALVPAANATLTYRQGGNEGTYTGAALHPTRVLSIPARPKAPEQPTDYFIDYPAETLGTGAGGTIQYAPQDTTAWSEISLGSSTDFATVGWSGATDYPLGLRLKYVIGATPAASAFASRIAVDTIVKRPPAPAFSAVYNVPPVSTLIVTMTAHATGANYQYRQGTGGWTTDTTLNGTGVSSPWPFNDTMNDYEVRLAATASAPTSYSATVSAPIIIDPVKMGSYRYGDAAASDPFSATVTNISNAAVPGVTLTLDDNTYFELVGTSPFAVPASGAYSGYTVRAKTGLNVGTYTTTLVATYSSGGGTPRTTRAEVSITIEKVPWDISAMQLSTSLVSDTGLTLNVTGAPQTATLSWRAGSAVWDGPSAAIGSNGLFSTAFSGLNPSSTYVLSVKALEDRNHYESVVAQTNAYTAYTTPVWSDVLYVDYREETLHFKDGYNPDDYEVAINGTVINRPHLYSLTTYANGADFSIAVSHKAGVAPNPPYPASGQAVETITARGGAPSGVATINATSTQANDGGIMLAGSFEYRAHSSATQAGGWITALNGVAVTYGSYDVHWPATATAFASAATTVSVYVAGVFSVTYDAGGGINAPVQNDGTAGTGNAFKNNDLVDVLGPGSMTRTGYAFIGWDVSPAVSFDGVADTTFISAVDAASAKTFIIAADTTLTARWTVKNTYTVTYDANGATSGAPGSKGNVSWTDTGLLPASAPVRAGWVFDGWYTALSGGIQVTASTPYSSLAANDTVSSVTIYAQWDERTDYEVAYDLNFTTSLPIANKTNVRFSDTNLLPATTPTRPGWAFDGWFTLALGGIQVQSTHAYSSLVTSDAVTTATIYAHWTERTDYTVIYNVNGATSGSIADKTSVKFGDSGLLPTGPLTKSGWTFLGWYTTLSAGGSAVTTSTVYSSLVANDTTMSV